MGDAELLPKLKSAYETMVTRTDPLSRHRNGKVPESWDCPKVQYYVGADVSVDKLAPHELEKNDQVDVHDCCTEYLLRLHLEDGILVHSKLGIHMSSTVVRSNTEEPWRFQPCALKPLSAGCLPKIRGDSHRNMLRVRVPIQQSHAMGSVDFQHSKFLRS